MSLLSKIQALKASIQETGGGAQQPNQESVPAGGATAGTTAPGPNSESPVPMNPAALNEQAPAVYRAKFATTAGDFTVEVTRAWAPLGADRFYNLVKNSFFTDAAFFRYVPGFIVQWGIPADPKVAAAWRSANIPDDKFNKSNSRGTITFATAGPNTRTTDA